MEFETMWARIKANQGKPELEKAFRLMPLTGPGQINGLVRGPSYVYGILSALYEE